MNLLLAIFILANIFLHVMHIMNFKRLFEFEAFQSKLTDKYTEAFKQQVEINKHMVELVELKGLNK